jgi:predicted nucleic acid-binding protein
VRDISTFASRYNLAESPDWQARAPLLMLVLDAHILIRGVLGKKVRLLPTEYQEAVRFCAPATAFREAKEDIQGIVLERGGDPDLALRTLNGLWDYIVSLQPEAYEAFESQARERLVRRDLDDWPILAAALALECAI